MQPAVRTLNGVMDFNAMFDLWKVVDQMDLKANLYGFKGRSNLGLSYQITQDDFLTSGIKENYDITDSSSKINVEIPLRIDRTRIHDIEYLNSIEVIQKIMNIPGVDKDLGVIQVQQKQGNDYQITNYRIMYNRQGISLRETNAGTILEETYKKTYGWNQEEFGGCFLIVVLPTPNLIFDCPIDVNPDYGAELQSFIGLPKNGSTLADTKKSYIEKAQKIILDGVQQQGVITAMSLIIFQKILEHRMGLKYSDTLYNRLHFSWLTTGGAFRTEPFDSLVIREGFRPNLDKYQVTYSTKSIGEFESNNIDPLNILKDDKVVLVDKKEGTIDMLSLFNFTDAEKDSSKEGAQKDHRRKLYNTITLNIKETSSDTSLPEIKAICEDIYAESKQELKARYDQIVARYKKLTPGCTPIMVETLAYPFIKKHMMSKINTADEHNLPFGKILDIRTYFEMAYGSFKEFFGTDLVQAFYNHLSKLNLDIYNLNNNRLEKSALTTGNFAGHVYPWMHQTVSFLPYTSSGTVESYNIRQRQKTVILVNDSLTKQSWRNKTRIYAKSLTEYNLGSNFIRVIDIKDKMDLMVFKKIARGFPGIRYYSEFSQLVQEPEKVQKVNVNINYYQTKSFNKHNKQVTPFILTSNDPIKHKVFVEFISTKNNIVIDGVTYDFKDFDLEHWTDVIQRASAMEICLVSSSNFKKLQTREDFVSLDELLQKDEVIKNIQEIRNDFIFIEPKYRAEIETCTFLIYSEFISPVTHPTYRSTFKHHPEVHSLHLDVLNSFTEESRVLYNKIYMLFARTHGSVMYNSTLNREVNKNIKHIPEPNTVYRILYDIMGESQDDIDINYALSKSSARGTGDYIGSTSRSGSRLFRLEELTDELEIVLKHRNNLNLSIEQYDTNHNKVIESFYNRAQLVVDILQC